jgi:hypothetical protein
VITVVSVSPGNRLGTARTAEVVAVPASISTVAVPTVWPVTVAWEVK